MDPVISDGGGYRGNGIPRLQQYRNRCYECTMKKGEKEQRNIVTLPISVGKEGDTVEEKLIFASETCPDYFPLFNRKYSPSQ